MSVGDWIEQRGWVRPDLGGACFASLPGTIAQLLGAQAHSPVLPAAVRGGLADRYERVVLVYFDAFGLEAALRHSDHSLLRRAAAHGGVFERITSEFPSTTTVHMTTIHTGLEVGEHGLYEWFVHDPELGRLIAPLPFAFAGDGQGPLPPELANRLYPETTLYELLAADGVASVVAGPAGVARSPASAALVRGSSAQIGFGEIVDGLAELAATLAALPAPAYGFVYLDSLDTLLHKVGPAQPHDTGVDEEITRVLDAIEQALLAALPEGTLLLLSADHGMTAVAPPATIYVNEGPRGAEVTAHLRTEPGGHPLAPAGSCRDLFLHALPGHVEELAGVLAAQLGERAEVRSASELIAAGLFGPDPSARLRDRLGDVVVLPVLGESVYWHTPGRFEQRLWGQHGGLTPQEMELPLIAIPAG